MEAGARRCFRRVRLVMWCYPFYLLLLGPYSALVGSIALSKLPDPVLALPVLPAAPVFQIPFVRSIYDGYLNWWYKDSSIDDPTGWY